MGIFSKIKNVLSKTKKSLSEKLSALFSSNKVGEDFYEELEEILISSDVSVDTSMEIVEAVREREKEEKTKDKEKITEFLKDALKDALESAGELEIETPAVIMVAGVNGVGKTTSIGKLSKMFLKKKKSVMLAAADTFRAGATEQLTIWAERTGVKIVKQAEGADPSAVVYDAISSAKAKKCDILIIDTAGRLHVKSNLMEELKKMDRVIKREYPEANYYKLIVLDATTGHNAENQLSFFDEAIGIDGIVLTKLDGTAKGGFIISLTSENEIPVVYVGTGEKEDDIEPFSATEFIDGMID